MMVVHACCDEPHAHASNIPLSALGWLVASIIGR
jgi:hypothetical protein